MQQSSDKECATGKQKSCAEVEDDEEEDEEEGELPVGKGKGKGEEYVGTDDKGLGEGRPSLLKLKIPGPRTVHSSTYSGRTPDGLW